MSKYTEHYKFKHSIRQTKERPIGWINRQLRIFTQHYLDTLPDKSDVDYIEFAKQDIRGLPSISIVYGANRGYCIGKQIHFKTYDNMLTYIQGYNAGIDELRYTWQNQTPY